MLYFVEYQQVIGKILEILPITIVKSNVGSAAQLAFKSKLARHTTLPATNFVVSVSAKAC